MEIMIDWANLITSILTILCSGGIAVFATLKYTRAKAKTEAQSESNKEQAERIDLGDKYVNQMLSMLEKIQEASNKNNALMGERNDESKVAFANMKIKMDEIHDDLVSVKGEVSSIVEYLNGGYAEYKANKE